uniref:Uncharacterized protein n=1 Tax=uncultured marine crenarchaeote HF4000_ANIW141M12 TaxID=455578 RepID=B3T5U9_9ARCH|nr:hypothetical protein ALOHA_HF4000ANIW141M12ctg1g9 [uncultured marine crenarchaeote HF4000_ANIW141M12]
MPLELSIFFSGTLPCAFFLCRSNRSGLGNSRSQTSHFVWILPFLLNSPIFCVIMKHIIKDINFLGRYGNQKHYCIRFWNNGSRNSSNFCNGRL